MLWNRKRSAHQRRGVIARGREGCVAGFAVDMHVRLTSIQIGIGYMSHH